MKTRLCIIILALLASACRTAVPRPQETQATESATQISLSTVVLSPTVTATSATPTATVTVTPTAEPTPLPLKCDPTEKPANINPLTCLPAGDPASLDRRPVAVKIQMYPRGQRPPWGISQADIVYDYYQNDGLTRLNAIFYSELPEKVGPVRSARLLDDQIIRMYKAIFAFGGADRRILSRLFNSDYLNRLIVEGTSSAEVLFREDPNGLALMFANTQKAGPYVVKTNQVDDTRQVLDGMSFQPEPPEGGEPGEIVIVRYSISAYILWKYDSTTGNYLRYQDASEDNNGQEERFTRLLDGIDNRQIEAENVVILLAPHTASELGRTITEISLLNEGEAYLFRDGRVYKDLKWARAPDQVLYLKDLNGANFPFKQGNTWFQVVNISNQPTPPQPVTQWVELVNGISTPQSSASLWRFDFRFP